MRVTSMLEKSLVFLAALAVNLGLYLLVPYIQILVQRHAVAPKSPKVIATNLMFEPPTAEKLVKKEIKEIKTESFRPPSLATARPSTPGGGVKIDLSPAGGEGQALLSGGDRTGPIGGGAGGGTGNGMAAMTYDPGQTDTDAKPLDSPPLSYPPRAERESITGYVMLTFVVNESGMAEQIQIVKEEPEGYGFGTSAIKAARETHFKPATLQKTSVKQRVKQPFNFTLNH